LASFFLRLVISVVVALVLGVASAWYAVTQGLSGFAVSNGAWQTSAEIGDAEAGLYTRAIVAAGGLLAMSKRETVYYNAVVDERGEALTGSCDYLITGGALDARWWSLTVYGADNYLIDNPWNIWSADGATLLPDEKAAWVLRLSAREPAEDGPWIPVKDGKPFAVTLRLYNPAPSVVENLDGIDLPKIVQESCR